MGDLATTVVQGSSNLVLKVFDETIRDEVLKALQRSEFELSCQMEGKDIRVKLGTSRKEHIDAGLKKVKESLDAFNKAARDERHSALTVLKKLNKILPEETVKLTTAEFEDLLKKAEKTAKTTCDGKEQELKQA